METSSLGQERKIVLHTGDISGNYSCDTFSGSTIQTSAFVAILPSSKSARVAAQRLKKELVEKITDPVGKIIGQNSSSSGTSILDSSTYQLPGPDICSHLLIWVGNDQTAEKEALELLDEWLAKGKNYIVLPVFPNIPQIHTVLPKSISHLNATKWSSSFYGVVSAIFSLIGLSPDQLRVFISYRQGETRHLAEQLFDALSRLRYDVFLDRFKIPLAVNFQEYLTQELADKAMIIVLESKTFYESEWTVYEVSFATKNRLGLMALQMPGAKPDSNSKKYVTGISEQQRIKLDITDFKTTDETVDLEVDTLDLTEDALDRILQRITTEHHRAHAFRLDYLTESVLSALRLAGTSEPELRNDGLIYVQPKAASGSNQQYVIAVTTRPFDFPDVHKTHTRLPSPTGQPPQFAIGILFGPPAFWIEANKARFKWLTGISKIYAFDEGELSSMADKLAGGTLY
ncbi:toll/interleukin-1 receptor domain-containing protein [Larkinella bovis]|uniref:Toll/interleukin-1 receptor domain-containing protein n=1 Tax=Larkinella bovis TaxID=683041 RepID=A0ABW0IEF0_9BACT